MTLPGTSAVTNWQRFNLSGIFTTGSSILPLDECPVTSFVICLFENCTDFANQTMLLTSGLSLSINREFPTPPTTYYLKAMTNSGKFMTTQMNVTICGYEEIKWIIPKVHVIQQISFGAINYNIRGLYRSTKPECPVTRLQLSMDSEGVEPLSDEW